jgi:hypothetical protein
LGQAEAPSRVVGCWPDSLIPGFRRPPGAVCPRVRPHDQPIRRGPKCLGSRRKDTRGNEFRPQLDAIRRIQSEDTNGGAATLRSTNDIRPLKTEMTRPTLPAGIEQTHDLSRPRIDAGEIGAFVLVVVMAGQGKVVRVIAAGMLFCDNMLDMKPVKRLPS